MARPVRKNRKSGRTKYEKDLPFGRKNFRILMLGVFVVIAGYLCMLEGSVDGILPIVVAPILLVTGYCIIIPLGIMFREDNDKNREISPKS